MSDHFRYAKFERLESRLLLAVTTGTDGLAAANHPAHSTAVASSGSSAATVANCSTSCGPIDNSLASVASGTTGTDPRQGSQAAPATSPTLSAADLNGILAAIHGAAHSQIMAALDQDHLHSPTFESSGDATDSSHADTADGDQKTAWLLTSADHHGSVVPEDAMSGTSSGHTMMDQATSVQPDSMAGPAADAMESEQYHVESSLLGIEIDAAAVPFEPPHVTVASEAEQALFVDDGIPAIEAPPTLADVNYALPVTTSELSVTESSTAPAAMAPPMTASAVDLTMVAMRPELADRSTEELAEEITSATQESDPRSRWLGIAIATGANLVAGTLEFRIARQGRAERSAADPTESDSSRQPPLRVVPGSRIG